MIKVERRALLRFAHRCMERSVRPTTRSICDGNHRQPSRGKDVWKRVGQILRRRGCWQVPAGLQVIAARTASFGAFRSGGHGDARRAGPTSYTYAQTPKESTDPRDQVQLYPLATVGNRRPSDAGPRPRSSTRSLRTIRCCETMQRGAKDREARLAVHAGAAEQEDAAEGGNCHHPNSELRKTVPWVVLRDRRRGSGAIAAVRMSAAPRTASILPRASAWCARGKKEDVMTVANVDRHRTRAKSKNVTRKSPNPAW